MYWCLLLKQVCYQQYHYCKQLSDLLMSKVNKSRGVRIIAGSWRGRRLPVLDLPELRPTGDRVRETLFNWLQTDIRGVRCLDLFAGSGALGFEAASRGAATVLMLEKQPQAIQQLRENVSLIKALNIEILELDSLNWLESGKNLRFDLVFLDPPFDSEWQTPILEKICKHGLLAEDALVYVESATKFSAPLAPSALTQIKLKKVGDVRMQLFCHKKTN